MKYEAYQAQADIMAQMRLYTEAMSTMVRQPWMAELPSARRLGAACMVFASAEVTHRRPDFGIPSVMLGEGASAREVLVHEEEVHVAPFCTLRRFRKDGIEQMAQPRVLLVAPMSGHFATLLRDTLQIGRAHV